MHARATRCSSIPQMKHVFKVSDRVVVDVEGFEPWPATIHSIVSGEDMKHVSYYVKLDGSSEIAPMKKEHIKLLGVVDSKRYSALSRDEMWHGARKRMEVIEGVFISMCGDNGFQCPLWNCVFVDDDYEKVSEVDEEDLKLLRVAHNAQVRYEELKTKFTLHAMQNRFLCKQKNDSDRFSQIVEKGKRKSQAVIRFPCPMCAKRFKTRMALKKHLECSKDCSKKTAPSFDQTKQCPKCYSLYKNEEMLLKHMAVHEKNLPKKKNIGIRDYLRQVMSNNKPNRLPSFVPIHSEKSKANVTNGRSQVSQARMLYKQEKKDESSEDSEEEKEEETEAEDDSESSSSSGTSSKVKPKRVVPKYHRCCNCRSNKRCKCTPRKSRDQEIHSEREKVRRKQMREAFEILADVVDNGGVNQRSKNVLLQLAKKTIEKLEEDSKRYERTLADLRDMNMRLDTRRYTLSC